MRKGYTLDVIELQPSGIVKVGTWDESNGFEAQRLAPTNSVFDNIDNSLANKTFIVLLSVPVWKLLYCHILESLNIFKFQNKPYASLVESHKKLEGNSQFEGYGVDLIKELSDKLGFQFILLNGGNDYGSFNRTTNVSTGMLKEIMEGVCLLKSSYF